MNQSITTTQTNKPTTRSFLDLIKEKQAVKARCLLLDTSGSMSGHCDDGRTQIAALRQLVEDFPGERKFIFNDVCYESTTIPAPDRGTSLCLALGTIKSQGITHAVLMTDGAPTDTGGDPENVYRAAEGLRLDIFYVGPGEPPPLLIELAKRTGGTFGASNLKETKALSQQIRGLLT
ncbi:MAG TPA: hypothetical protein VLH56_19010 [Dissulfurispiraceae bacterium]|nr:hypothetical protein [Dissulfurispiraceae bacterium]